MNRRFLSRREFLGAAAAASASSLLGGSAVRAEGQTAQTAPATQPVRPNILWITCEDIGPNLGCYGDPDARTPNLDALASRGLRYSVCWSNAPVCAPARTSIISGMYPCSTGSEHMRSMVPMPAGAKMFPQLLRQAGYYCTNNSKEDYNLEKPDGVWDESSGKAHYRNRPQGQPFFAVFNFTNTHESQIRNKTPLQRDPASVRLPPYHPDCPEARDNWARYHDNIARMDQQAGKLLEELEQAGLAGETIVFFYGDHGSGMPGHKRVPRNSGLHAPLIVHVPEKFRSLAPSDYAPGKSTDRLASFVDLAPTVLGLAGLPVPAYVQGRALFGPADRGPNAYVFGLRGRMDERYDCIRSLRDGRYVYVRNYMPHLPYGQHVEYMFATQTTQAWKKLFDEGKLNPVQAAFWKVKPPEELYDLKEDPHETKNLATVPEHRKTLERMRLALHDWQKQVCDVGLLPEPDMHERARGSTPYDMGHDPTVYPFERVRAAAELASFVKLGDLDRVPTRLADDDPEMVLHAQLTERMRENAARSLANLLGDPEPAVRYWAALGLLMRGEGAVKGNLADLRKGLADRSPSVRIVAAQALAQHGEAGDREPALKALGDLIEPDRDLFATFMALNAVDALDEKARPLADKIRALRGPKKGHRSGEAVGKLSRKILADLGDKPAPDADEKKPRNRKAK